MKTVSDHREEKARISGNHEAWIADQAAIRFEKARNEYLKNNPDVGTIIRDGKEIFYRNLTPLHLGKIQEFSPESVIG
jgi:hypothetical protein